MALFHDSAIVGASGNQGGTGGYQISRSLRFNSADSAYLSRTPASAGNRKTFTFSCWIKRSKAGDFRAIFSAATDTSNLFIIRFTDADLLEIRSATGGSTVFQLITTQVFRDFSAWYHIVVAVDTTNATGGDRVRLYINGSEITVFNTDTVPTQNADSWANNNVLHEICRQANNPSNYYQDGYLADVHLIDGQQLTPTSFAETNATTGQWVPKAYSGSYGTNGFRLDFSDNSAATATTLGKDRAGSNNWTPNNLSVTAGAGNDSLVDTPTSYGTDTGAGGEVRGNYCTLNPLANNGGNLSNGNYDHSGVTAITAGTLFPSSGKWYFEVTCNTYSGGGSLGYTAVGVIKSDQSIDTIPASGASVPSGLWVYRNDALKINNGTSVSYGNTWTAGDVIGVAFDVGNGKLWFAKNGTWQASGDPAAGTSAAYTNLSGSIGVAINDQGSYTATYSLNTGARPFAYTAPSGFKALCDTNLPAPVVAKPNTVMDVKLYTGNGSTQTISGLGFSPDLVWIKSRSAAYNNRLYDQVRGVENVLNSNTTAAEGSDGTGLTAFTSSGFTLGSSLAQNENNSTFVAWCWDAGSSTVTNTSGSISSQVRANASAGFSIVTYTGTGSAATVGHGLGVAPAMVIVKNRSTAGTSWRVYHKNLTSASYNLYLDLTSAQDGPSSAFWNDTAPTSTVFSVGTSSGTNESTKNMVAYCFAPVAGYSAFGSYTGNGSTDGPFVFTGFRPRWVMIKNSSANSLSAYGSWKIIDASRDSYNGGNPAALYANASYAEGKRGNGDNDTYTERLDLLSNGFKLGAASTYDIETNESGVTYIYAAFAESPFQYARAR